MDGPYLLKLLRVPGMTAELAAAIAERFPDLENLRDASEEDLVRTPGVTRDLARLLLDTARAGRDATLLPLCPECGSFLGTEESECILCGTPVEPKVAIPADVTPVEKLLFAHEGEVKICWRCGAYLEPHSTGCSVCGTSYTREELLRLPAVDVRPLPDAPDATCPHCGAYRLDGITGCVICGEPMVAAATPPAITQNGKGLGRDFLTRWQRVASEEVAPEVTVSELEAELRAVERIIESKPELEGAWLRKGRILVSLGKPESAVDAFDRAGQLNPARDEEYRREALEALGPRPAPFFLPARWGGKPSTAPASTPGRGIGPVRRPHRPLLPPAEVDAISRAIRQYDELLAIDPSQPVAWETKGELLRRLGRDLEATECFRKAADLGLGVRTPTRHAPKEFHTRPPLAKVPPRGATMAGVNGRVNGLTNGKVNGLIKGRVNGLTNGRVNGLTNGMGRVNGTLAGLTLGGRTNGLVNGDGFTNGRRASSRGGPMRDRGWARSLVGVASVVLLLVLVPVVLSMFTTPTAVAGIVIDGSFADWEQVPLEFFDRTSDVVGNPDVNLLAYKVSADGFVLSLYARVEGLAFRGVGNGSDLFVTLIDVDGRPDTGYDAGGFGADYAVEVYGWDAGIQGAPAFRFEGTNRRDWHGFRGIGTATAAARGSELEFGLDIDSPQDAQVLLVAADGHGLRDAADAVVRPGSGALAVRESRVGPEVITSLGESGIMRLDAWAPGPPVPIAGLNVTARGSAPDSAAMLHLYRDDGDGQFGAGDVRVSSAAVSQGRSTFPAAATVASPMTFFVVAEFASLPPNATFGLAFDGFDTPATVTVASRDPFLAYLARAPEPSVDGAFGDWSTIPRSIDPAGDVANRSMGSAVINRNIDLVETGSHFAGNVSFYLRVDGTMLGGIDTPNLRARTGPPGEGDSDLDTVPDNVEFTLGNPALSYDFDNDNITDSNEFGDVDSDGVIDYPSGPDLWLNTTIPLWYPPPFAGRTVSRYIGPIAPPVFEGVDSAIVYVDGDNRTDTGLVTTFGTSTLGLDWAVVVIGRHGAVISSEVYRYRPGASVPWELVTGVPAAVDATRLEVSVPSAILNLSADYRTAYYATDWKLSYDISLPTPPGRSAGLGTRSPAGDNVVINEISSRPNPEWVELVNPTASPISISGWRIQRRGGGGGWTTIYTFPTGSVIGAWGSGSEYRAINLPSGRLPNGRATVRLLTSGPTTVDMTAYPSVPSGRTWARFKDPTTGKPIDSDSAMDFYTSLFPSRTGPNDRHRPTIAAAKIADRSTAAPGDTITYTVYYNNTDTGRANHVWANDTLPAEVTFLGATVAASSNSGQTYSWHFMNVEPNTVNSVAITVKVNDGTVDGAVLVNQVTVEYTDQLNRTMVGSRAWSNVTVSRPVITVAIVGDKANAIPGDNITYTVYYNNTGSSSAQHVWINTTLPADVTFLSSSAPPTTVDGQTYGWHFTNVAPGAYSFTITVTVNMNASSSQLVSWVFLNYTTQNGYGLEGSAASWTTAIPEFSDFLFVGLVPLLFIAIRRRRRAVRT